LAGLAQDPAFDRPNGRIVGGSRKSIPEQDVQHPQGADYGIEPVLAGGVVPESSIDLIS